ncbi:hypothetical protein PV328_010689 [Microctonus aethiopoides]|uniref:EF-hand domain-containing protein n=1 Tax=Microctonus aethiopoides TaxID=144406 RepID=A0AA39FIA0_9HYME|nr:hypothetical protein PV328_010689 [Microctonus aethiopoides]
MLGDVELEKQHRTQRKARVSGSLEPTQLEKRISDAFDVFDNARSHEVDVRELGTIIRSLGCVITEAELQEIQVEVEDVENNCVTQDRFPADPEDLLRSFKILDPANHGYIMRADMEKAMMEIGEPFTKEEIDEMMAVACDPETNKINYEHYINSLIIKIDDEKNVYKIAREMNYSELITDVSDINSKPKS